jgi:hypothetical protein
MAIAAPNPDAQLVMNLLAAGAAADAQDSAGNTPLILAVKAGGLIGLKLAQLLTSFAAKRSTSRGSTSANDVLVIDAVNTAGKSALSLSVDAVAQAQRLTGARQVDAHSVEMQLLGLVLQQQPQVPKQLGSSLVQQGLRGELPDAVTAQVRL